MKLISSKEVYKCSLFSVTEDYASDGKGYEIRRSIVRHAGSAVMMAVDDRKRILLVRQYRLPTGMKMWELPRMVVRWWLVWSRRGQRRRMNEI